MIKPDGKLINISEKILCGDKNAVRWVNHSSGHGVIQAQGWQPVDGGREEDGRQVTDQCARSSLDILMILTCFVLFWFAWAQILVCLSGSP